MEEYLKNVIGNINYMEHICMKKGIGSLPFDIENHVGFDHSSLRPMLLSLDEISFRTIKRGYGGGYIYTAIKLDD